MIQVFISIVQIDWSVVRIINLIQIMFGLPVNSPPVNVHNNIEQVSSYKYSWNTHVDNIFIELQTAAKTQMLLLFLPSIL